MGEYKKQLSAYICRYWQICADSCLILHLVVYQNYTDAQMNAPVTRGEFVHIFHGAESAYAAINTVADNSIPDVKMTDKFAAEIYEVYRAGILTGSDAKGTFHSASSIKRSEVSAILVRMFDTASRQSITLK